VPGNVLDPRMEAVPTHFNSITAESIMKWGDLAHEVGIYDFSQADGLAIELTEVDIAKTALQTRLIEGEDLWELQAEVYDRLASSCIAVEACQGITTWGIDDAHTWLDEFPPFSLSAPNASLRERTTGTYLPGGPP
jgi:GH35 family endo-1,4-beta-xylanase